MNPTLRRRRGSIAGAMPSLFVLALLVGGCAEATFSAHNRDNNVEDIKRAMAASEGPKPGTTGHLAFLVTAGGPADKSLVGFDLFAQKVAWTEKADVRSRVVAGKGLIVHRQGASDLVGRDPQSGRVQFTVTLGGAEKFVGAALDDERVYYVVQDSGGAQRTSSLVAVDRTGHQLWRFPAAGSLGAPAARGGVVAVPHAYQNITFVDGKTGKELARVRATDEQVTFVRALPEGFFYGGAKGVYLFDEKSAGGTKKESSYVEANLGSDQVRTFYYWDGYQLAQSDYSAFDRNRLLWRGEPRGGTAAFHDDAAILHSYRYMFAFDAKGGKLRWAYAHPRTDLVAADDVGPSVVFASVDGDVGVLDAHNGSVRMTVKTGLKLSGATFDADGFTGGKDGEPTDVVQTLNSIIWDHDARFTAVKVFAVDALGDVPGKDASAALLKVVLADKDMPATVQKKAGEELVARKDKDAAPLFVDALKVRYDFLEDRHPHGVEILARAVSSLDAKEAAPELAAHLLDAATPQGSLKDLAAALAGLGGPAAIKALREFLLTYRADPNFIADPNSLNIAAEGLLKLGGPEERRTVTYVAEEKRTLQPVATYVKKMLADTAPKKR